MHNNISVPSSSHSHNIIPDTHYDYNTILAQFSSSNTKPITIKDLQSEI